jgi:hypothetical protein
MAHLFTFVLFVLSLAAVAGLGWTAFHLLRLDGAISDHSAALRQYENRQEAIFALDSMDMALHRFILDGNTANVDLIRLNKDLVERLAQKDAAAQNDKMLQDLVAREQQWYAQFAQPLIDQRRQLPAGQGLREDLLNRYRMTKKDLATFDTEMAAQTAYQHDVQNLLDAQKHIGPGPVVRFGAAVLVVVVIFAVAWGTFRNIGRLHRVARGDDEEDEDDDEEETH